MKRLPIFLSLFALVALSASIAYWVLQLYQPVQRVLAAAPASAMAEPGVDAATTLFGGQAAAAAASNFQLTGVIAAGRDSVAIIVADGTPPKALKLGKEVVSGVTVQEVHPRYVMLSDGGVLKRIELAADSKSASGVLASPLPSQAPAQQPSQQFQRPPQLPTDAEPAQIPSMQGPAPADATPPPPPPPPPVQMAPATRPVTNDGDQSPLR